MSSIVSIKAALEQALKTGTTPFPLGWENVAFTPPVDGSAFAVATLLPATPDNPTMGDGFYREVGLLQVTLSYPVGNGSGKAYAKADEIRALFPRGSSCTSGGITVRITRTPVVGPGLPQSDRFVLPVRITYSADIFA